MQFAAERSFVKRLNILKLVLEAIPAQINLVRGNGVEHEGIVGIG
jgi:hypothetical protein